MNWDALFAMQKKLDTYIADNQDLNGTEVVEEKVLALLVELGELANETRCFKFWSQKPPSEKSIILEEYVDNIHFLLSLGLDKGFQCSEIEVSNDAPSETVAFNQTFVRCLRFYQSPTDQNYRAMFEQYLQLAGVLGFSEKDIIEAYHAKNAVNYERQENGY